MCTRNICCHISASVLSLHAEWIYRLPKSTLEDHDLDQVSDNEDTSPSKQCAFPELDARMLGQRLERGHVVLVLWCVARSVRVSLRVDHTQYRCGGRSRRGGSGGKKGEPGVGEY